MNKNALAGTFQANLNNLGGRAQILEQMFNHKSGIVHAKPAIDNSEPFRFYNELNISQSVQSNKKLSPLSCSSSHKIKNKNLKYTSSIQQLIQNQKKALITDQNVYTDCSDYNPYHIDSCATLRKNSASIHLESKEKLKSNTSCLYNIIKSAHVSPIRRGREQLQNDINHQLNLESQRKRIQNLGSLNERKKNSNDATVYPSLIQRAQRSTTLIDYYDTRILKNPSNESIREEKQDKKEKKKRKKSKRKTSKKSKKEKQHNSSFELNENDNKLIRINSNSPSKSQSQNESNFYIAPLQKNVFNNAYNPNRNQHKQNYLQNTLSQINPFSPSLTQQSSQSFLFHSINMSRDYEIFDYVHDIPFVRTFNYDELRIRLVNIIIKYQIFSDEELNDLFAKTQLKNNHLDSIKLNQIFDQIGKDIIKRLHQEK
ncbi:hypothetical protein ABPG74_022021 [Tetrahymena malaccensis]